MAYMYIYNNHGPYNSFNHTITGKNNYKKKTEMQAKVDSKVAPTRDYQDYVPATEIIEEEDCDTLLIYLPGFKKDELKVQLTPTPSLKISGERHIGDNKWSRFQKEYPVSTNCETNKITAKFDVGLLYIRQPKLITPMVKKDEEKPINEAQKPQKNETETPLPQPTEVNNTSKQRDETKSGDKMEDEEKIASKLDETDAGDVDQKSREEEKEQRKGVVENDAKGKRKRVDDFVTENFTADRVKMAKKVGMMMSVVVAALSAIVLGIYMKNLVMPAKNYEN